MDVGGDASHSGLQPPISGQQQHQQQHPQPHHQPGPSRTLPISPPPHCSFVLLAEFDIDRGSTLAHVYPEKHDVVESHDDHTLAELMLPDGAHARGEDWTVFMLRGGQRNAGVDGNNVDDDDDGDGDDADRDDTTFVLNLVRTKHDESVRRGALVKAMAIGTRHPCIHVFKPILILALDEYFNAPRPAALARLHDAINGIDLTPAPRLTRSEKLILRASDRRDLFADKFATYDSAVVAPPPPRDTHFWETHVRYGKMDIPLKWPLDGFADEVGEYSLSLLFATFSSSPVAGPLHAHLHSNGSNTPPMAVLFNAILTCKRVIFLGHNLPAATVAAHVLAAAALASGCGAVIPGIVRQRCHPYANLISLDELEETPGFIAGVTNPRFEELRCWDLLCNIETGKMTIAKDIEPARVALAAAAAAGVNTQPMTGGGIGSLNGSMGMGSMHTSTSGRRGSNDFEGGGAATSSSSSGGHSATTAGQRSFGVHSLPMTSATSATTSEFGSMSLTSPIAPNPPASSAASLSSASLSLSAALPPSGIPDARADSFDALFMDDVLAAVSSRYSESYVRTRIIDYVVTFTRHITRHEDYFYGPNAFSPASCRFLHQPYLNGQLGSGTAFGHRDAEMREIVSNAGRVEGFRATETYAAWNSADAARRRRQRTIFSAGSSSSPSTSPDIWHQISRLRGRGRVLSPQEVELIFATLDACVRTPEEIVELLTLLPSHAGGLSPLAHGLYHPSAAVRLAACELLGRIAAHASAGVRFIASLSLFHRLAMGRIQHQYRQDVGRLQQQQQQQQQGQQPSSSTPRSATPVRAKSPGGGGSPLNIATLKQRERERKLSHLQQQQGGGSGSGGVSGGNGSGSGGGGSGDSSSIASTTTSSSFLAAPRGASISRQSSNASVATLGAASSSAAAASAAAASGA